MDRFDAAVIGAGPEGLIAAITLARAGLKVIALEKNADVGGRAATQEFHPGFKASLYLDELAAIPLRLFRSLDLARHGAVMVPAPASVCITPAGTSIVFSDGERTSRSVAAEARESLLEFRRHIESMQEAIAARATAVSSRTRTARFWRRWKPEPPWPGDEWASASMEDVLSTRIFDPLVRVHLAADAISGRAASPFLAGSALHLLAPGTGRSGQVAGGLGMLADALRRIAEKAAVTLRSRAAVTGITTKWGRVKKLATASGDVISARAIVSALDLKRTLGLLTHNDLTDAMSARSGQFRMCAQSARVLFALDGIPSLTFSNDAPDAGQGVIHIVDSLDAMSGAYDFWRAGRFPEAPLVTLRFPSLADPRLAPPGKTLMTATLSPIPSPSVNGPWTHARREHLAAIALAAAERVAAGISAQVLFHRTIVAPDVEDALGLTCGDLDGGELAPDQALGFRPFASDGWEDGRTPVRGLYLAGPSGPPAPFVLGASGERAARALIADIKERRL